MSRSSVSPPKVTTSVLSAGDGISKDIEAIKANAIKFGGKSGYFVSVQRLKMMEKEVDDLMVSGATTKTPSDLIAMNEQINMLQTSQLELQQRLESEKMVVAKGKGDLEQMRSSLAAKEQLLAKAEKDTLNTIKVLQEELAEKAKHNAQLQQDFLRAKKGFDPDLATKLQEQKKAAGLEVHNLTNSVSELRAELARERKAVAAGKIAIQKLQDSVNDKVQANAHAATALKGKTEIFGTKKVSFNVSPTLQALVGAKRVKHLIAAAEAKEENVKDRLFETLQGLRGTKDKKMLGLIDVLQMALDWAKEKSFKARKVIAQWVSKIIKDIREMSLRSIQEYRDELKRLIDTRKAINGKAVDRGLTRSELQAIASQPLSYWEEAKCWFIAIKNHTVRTFRKERPSVSPISGVLYKAWDWLKSKFSQKKSDEDVIFDAAEYGYDGPVNLVDVEPKPEE